MTDKSMHRSLAKFRILTLGLLACSSTYSHHDPYHARTNDHNLNGNDCNDRLPTDKKRRRKQSWVVDSGATLHCIGDKSLLTHTYKNHPPVKLKVADDRVLESHAVGTVDVKLTENVHVYTLN